MIVSYRSRGGLGRNGEKESKVSEDLKIEVITGRSFEGFTR